MSGLLAVLYGISSYAVFVFTLLYAIGFVGNIVVPKAIDLGIAAGLFNALVLGWVSPKCNTLMQTAVG